MPAEPDLASLVPPPAAAAAAAPAATVPATEPVSTPAPGLLAPVDDGRPPVPESAVLTASVLSQLTDPLPLGRVLETDDPDDPAAQKAAVRRGLRVVTASALPVGRRRRLLGSWGLLSIEQLLWQAEPAVVGAAVTRIAGGEWWAAGLIAAIVGVSGALAVWRTRYDTRTFSRMHARLAAGVLARQRGARPVAESNGDAANGDDAAPFAADATAAHSTSAVSRTAARVNLAGKVTDFLESVLPQGVNGIASVIGATVMLGWYDVRLAPLCLLLGVVGIAWNLRLGRETATLSRGMNDQAEREIAAISAGTAEAASDHYGRLSSWRSRIGAVEATALGGTRAVQFVLLIAALLLCGGGGGALAVGTIYAVIRYVQKFGEGMAELPSLVRRCVILRDVLRRLGS